MPANRTSSTCHFADSTNTKRGSTQLCSTPHFTSNENNPDTYPRLSTTHHHLITIYTAVRTVSYFLQCYSTGTCMISSQTSMHIHAHSVHILFQGRLRGVGIKTKQLLVTIWIAFALTISSGIIPTEPLGFTAVPQAHACIGQGAGGGC